jgi:hypothetical protein
MDKTPGKGNDAPTKRYKGEGRVSFLAHLDSIRQEVEAGWPLQAVYDRHKDHLNIQYMQFHRYVSKYIKGEVSPTPTKSGMDTAALGKALPKVQPPKAMAPKKSLTDATPLSDSELF